MPPCLVLLVLIVNPSLVDNTYQQGYSPKHFVRDSADQHMLGMVLIQTHKHLAVVVLTPTFIGNGANTNPWQEHQ